jgi:hypothetical protein
MKNLPEPKIAPRQKPRPENLNEGYFAAGDAASGLVIKERPLVTSPKHSQNLVGAILRQAPRWQIPTDPPRV